MSLLRITGGNSIPDTGPHAHFNNYKDIVTDAWALRDQTEIVNVRVVAGDTMWNYNSTVDAAHAILPSGQISMESAENLAMAFAGRYTSGTNPALSVQYEFMYGSEWNVQAPADLEALETHKAFQIYDDVGEPADGGSRRIEFQSRYDFVDASCVGGCTIRTYHFDHGYGLGEITTIFDPQGAGTNDDDFQPGGGSAELIGEKPWVSTDHLSTTEKPFLLFAGVWIRVTHIFELDGTDGRYTLIMSDENTDATTVIEDPDVSGSGYLLTSTYSPSYAWAFDGFQVEFNSSQSPSGSGFNKNIYVRNVLVDTSVLPHGGRPG